MMRNEVSTWTRREFFNKKIKLLDDDHFLIRKFAKKKKYYAVLRKLRNCFKRRLTGNKWPFL